MRALVLRLFLPFAAVSSIALCPGDAVSQVICGGMLRQDAFLSADLNCEGDGLRLAADGITLDCGGHAIQGEAQPDSAGIRLAGVRGATIRNCRISGFRTQIQAEDSPDLAILGDHLSAGRQARGLTARRCARLLMTSSRVDESLLAVYLDSSPDAALIGNEFEPHRGNYRGRRRAGFR